MAILNMFGGAGGGVRIPLESPTAFTASPQAGKVVLTWTDPVDKVASPGGEMVAPWSYTIVVRKVGSYPQTPKDGVEVTRETTRNQYQTTGFEDTLSIENGITYYYALFAVSTFGVWSEPATDTAMPTAAHPQFYQTKSITSTYPQTQFRGVLSSTTNHFVFAGGITYGSGTTEYFGQTFALDKNLSKQVLDECLGGENVNPGKFDQYAIFVGGKSYGSWERPSGSISSTNMYSADLTAHRVRIGEGEDCTTGIGSSNTHAIFIGGMYYNYGDQYVSSSAVNTQLTVSELTLEKNLINASGTHVGEYIIFAGAVWEDGGDVQAPFAYTSSLTKVGGLTALHQNSFDLEDMEMTRPIGTASTGNYALFAGINKGVGDISSNKYASSAIVTAYDQSLTRQPQLTLSSTPDYPVVGGEVDEFAMFGWSVYGSDDTQFSADCFDNTLVKTSNLGTITQMSLSTELCVGSGLVDNLVMYARMELAHHGAYMFQCV